MAARDDVPPALMRTLVVVWTLVGVGVLVWGVVRLFGEPLAFLLAPFLFASIIVYLLAPLVDMASRLGLPRMFATLLTYVVVAAVLTVVGWALIPLLSRQLVALVDGLPDIVVGVREALGRFLDLVGLPGLLPPDSQPLDLGEWVASVVEGNGDQVVGILGAVRAVVGSFVSGVLGLVLAPVLAFYVLGDLPRVTAGAQRLIPPDRRGELIDVARRILSTVGAYFRGQVLVATFVGVATSIGLGVLGLPFWAIIGALTGLIGVVVAPTVGNGLTQAVAVVLIMVAVQQIDNHLITPSVLSRTVHVHPVTIIVSLIFAANMFGVVGMLVAIPTVAALKLIILYLLVTRVPSMAHLSDPDQFLDGVPLPPARPGSLSGISQQLRAVRDRRRGDAVSGDGRPADDAATVPTAAPAATDPTRDGS